MTEQSLRSAARGHSIPSTHIPSVSYYCPLKGIEMKGSDLRKTKETCTTQIYKNQSEVKFHAHNCTRSPFQIARAQIQAVTIMCCCKCHEKKKKKRARETIPGTSKAPRKTQGHSIQAGNISPLTDIVTRSFLRVNRVNIIKDPLFTTYYAPVIENIA